MAAKKKTEQELFEENIQEFLTKNNVNAELQIMKEGRLSKGDIQPHGSTYLLHLNTKEHEKIIKKLKNKGWKKHKEQFDKFGGDILDDETILLSYKPFNFL